MKLSSENIIRILPAVPLFLVPLIFTYRATHYFVPKTALLQLSGFSILTAWIFVATVKNRCKEIKIYATDLPVLCLLAWTGLSALWADNVFLSVEKTLFLSSLVAIYFVVSRTSPHVKLFSSAVSCAATAAAIYGLLQFAGFDFLCPKPHAPVSTLGNLSFAGEFISAAAMLTAGLFLNSGKHGRIAAGGAGAIQLAYLLVTGSRGGWIGLIAGSAVLFMLTFKTRRQAEMALFYSLLVLAAALVLTAAVGGAETLDSVAARAYSIFDLQHPSVQVRLYTWQSTIEMIKERPVLGTGAGNFQIVFPLFRSLEETRISGIVTQVARAHNDYLETASDLGIAGFALLLWMLAQTLKILKESRRSISRLEAGTGAGIASILAAAFFGFPLQTASTALIFWTGLGVVARIGKARRTFRLPENPAPAAAVASFILLFVFFHTYGWLSADIHLQKALRHEERGEIEMMKEELEASIRLYYPSIQSHNRLAGAYIKLGDLENAYASLNAILRLHPNHAWAHRALGQIYLELHEKNRGMFLLHRAARLNPVFISYLGRTYLRAGDLETAGHYLREQMRLGFADEHTYTYLGELYEAKGEKERAGRAYRRALEINPNMPEAVRRMRALDRETDGR